jgi:succinoglycan biosynthesis transport protein ExoP
MELKQMIFLLRKWLWLLILGLVLGAGGGIFFSRIQTPVYQATTKVLITRAPQSSTGVQSVLDNSVTTQTYTEILTMQPVLKAASEKVGFDVSSNNIQVSVITNTQIVQVGVTDQYPERSALIANALVETASQQYMDIQTKQYVAAEENIQTKVDQLQSQITSLQAQIDQSSTANLETQIQQVQEQMAPLQEEVNKLQQEIASLTPPISISQRTKIADDQARINEIAPLLSLYQQIYSNLVVLKTPLSNSTSGYNQLSTLQATLNLYNQIYANLISNLETIRLAKLNNTSNANQIEPASVPEKPVRPQPMLYTALAGFCGVILAAGSILLIEYLDDTLKTPEEIKRLFNLPVIGYIINGRKKEKGKEKIMVDRESHSPVNESFRSLKTNLEILGFGRSIKTILIASAEQGEGKSTIAANLAVTLTQDGKRVLLLDADLRQPTLHQIFNISNHSGLTDVLNKELEIDAVSHSWKKFGTLKVIPSGQLVPNSIELLGSERMREVLTTLGKSFDAILIDTPPCFVADAQALAEKVDGVVLVVQPGVTHRDAVSGALEQFNHTGVKVVGVVLNRVQYTKADHYKRYRYYSNKSNRSKETKSTNPHRKKSSLFSKSISNTLAKLKRSKTSEKNNPPANKLEM